MQPVVHGRRKFFESPAFIGCALAVSRTLYESLWGFDPHMRKWGVEDLDMSLKCWLSGHAILHDPQAVVGHRFRNKFDNYDAPIEGFLVNQLRMARKNFTPAVWCQWVEATRQRHAKHVTEYPEGLWARVWTMFEAGRASATERQSANRRLPGHAKSPGRPAPCSESAQRFSRTESARGGAGWSVSGSTGHTFRGTRSCRRISCAAQGGFRKKRCGIVGPSRRMAQRQERHAAVMRHHHLARLGRAARLTKLRRIVNRVEKAIGAAIAQPLQPSQVGAGFARSHDQCQGGGIGSNHQMLA